MTRQVIEFVKICKMWSFLLILSFIFVSVNAYGKFVVLQSPSSLEFKGKEDLSIDNLVDVFLVSLGKPARESSNWGGLYIKDPFNLPKKVITVTIDGVNEINFSNKQEASYSLYGDEIYQSVDGLIDMLRDDNSTVLSLDLNQGKTQLETFSDIFGKDNSIQPLSKSYFANLKPDIHSEDKMFYEQADIINQLMDKNVYNNIPDFTTIRISLKPLADAHGETSPAFLESRKYITNAVKDLCDGLNSEYKDKILFTVITGKESEHYRYRRQADEVNPDTLNLATHYNDDYPVIFNIILWFGVIMAFSLLAISYTIATMDPGRDSIIYRMTSTRMKKDN